MPFVIGGYTELGFGTPQRSFDGVLDSILKPILTLLYHRKDACFSLALSGAMIEWLEAYHPEVNMLISDLVKKNQLCMIGGAYYQGILSLLSSKDRGGQIEKSTTMIRLTYGQRIDTMFCYSQVFSPYVLHTTSLCGIRNLVISGSGASTDTPIAPFVMREQDKMMHIFPIDDRVSTLTWQLSEGTLTSVAYLKEMETLVPTLSQTVLFLNLDQLAKAALSPETTQKLCDLLFSRPTSLLSSFEPVEEKGYQCDGWYGHDAVKVGEGCFNQLFVKDQALSYLYNRYSTLLEIAKARRKSRDVKKQMEKLLLCCGAGNPFVMDADASALRPSVRQWCYHKLTEAQLLLDPKLPQRYDFDRDGIEEYAYQGKNFLAVLTPLGGAVSELVHLATLTNYAGAGVPLLEFGSSDAIHSGSTGEMLRLFTDLFFSDPATASIAQHAVRLRYAVDDTLGPKGEFSMVGVQGTLTYAKKFKFRQNTVLVDVSLSNTGVTPCNGWYGMAFPLSVVPPKEADSVTCSVTDMEHKSRSCLERKMIQSGIRSARLFVGSTVTLFSATPCTLVKEDHTITTKTVQHEETILMDVLLLPCFPVDLPPGATCSFTLGLRVEKK